MDKFTLQITDDGNISSFRNVVFENIKFKTMDNTRNNNNNVYGNVKSSETFRFRGYDFKFSSTYETYDTEYGNVNIKTNLKA
jgi:hypothetical protein